jgi:hypothetical protein
VPPWWLGLDDLGQLQQLRTEVGALRSCGLQIDQYARLSSLCREPEGYAFP